EPALARLAELRAGSAPVENAVTRAHARWRELFALRDWDAMGEIFSEDTSIDDRRSGVRTRMVGLDARVTTSRLAVDSQMAGVVIATRGERLALVLVHW